MELSWLLMILKIDLSLDFELNLFEDSGSDIVRIRPVFEIELETVLELQIRSVQSFKSDLISA